MHKEVIIHCDLVMSVFFVFNLPTITKLINIFISISDHAMYFIHRHNIIRPEDLGLSRKKNDMSNNSTNIRGVLPYIDSQ